MANMNENEQLKHKHVNMVEHISAMATDLTEVNCACKA